MNKISVDINNGRKMTLEQYKHDGGIRVTTGRGKVIDNGFEISPGDLVMLVNFYLNCKEGIEQSDYIK